MAIDDTMSQILSVGATIFSDRGDVRMRTALQQLAQKFSIQGGGFWIDKQQPARRYIVFQQQGEGDNWQPELSRTVSSLVMIALKDAQIDQKESRFKRVWGLPERYLQEQAQRRFADKQQKRSPGDTMMESVNMDRPVALCEDPFATQAGLEPVEPQRLTDRHISFNLPYGKESVFMHALENLGTEMSEHPDLSTQCSTATDLQLNALNHVYGVKSLTELARGENGKLHFVLELQNAPEPLCEELRRFSHHDWRKCPLSEEINTRGGHMIPCTGYDLKLDCDATDFPQAADAIRAYGQRCLDLKNRYLAGRAEPREI